MTISLPPVIPITMAQLAKLSPREQDIVACLMAGLSPPNAAKTLAISWHTARNHLKQVNRKLGVKSQIELVARIAASVEHARLVLGAARDAVIATSLLAPYAPTTAPPSQLPHPACAP